MSWGQYALLYRTHEIGYNAEAGFLREGLPCRMAQGRALADDPVVSYLIAALRVISAPDDPSIRTISSVVLPRACSTAHARKQTKEASDPLLAGCGALSERSRHRRKIRRRSPRSATRELATSNDRHRPRRRLLSSEWASTGPWLEENHEEPPTCRAREVHSCNRLKEAIDLEDLGSTRGGCEIASRASGRNRITRTLVHFPDDASIS